MIQKPFALTFQSVVEKLETDINKGLTNKEASNRLLKYKDNEIQKKESQNKWGVLISQFLDPIIYILLVAILLAFLFQNWLEGIAILIVIVITISIGFIMELQALRSLEALHKIGQAIVWVIRNGEAQQIQESKIVPGEIILLEKGDVVTADARLVELKNLTVKEAALTGESAPVGKTLDPLPKNTSLIMQANMVFKGTVVITGSAKAIVVATGMNTQLGKIQQLATDVKREYTPLDKKLNTLSKHLIWLTLIFTVIIVVSGFIRGKDMVLVIQTGIALAVATIPEGLPIVVTIALAHGILRLSKKKVIIKRLEDVQTLGATNIICTDKTGTLTEDKMKVHTLAFEDALFMNVIKNEGDILLELKKRSDFNHMILCGIVCNDVKLTSYKRHGDTIDMELLNYAEQVGYHLESIRNNYPEIEKLPFDTQRKMMATAHTHKNAYLVFAKGAFESIVDHCDYILKNDKTKPFTNKKLWLTKVNDLASQGLRTLAFAFKELKTKPKKNEFWEQLTFVGVIGFIDPARQDVKPSIESYKKAGIKVVMMTGDHPGTAKKIAQEIGLITSNPAQNKVLLGSDFNNIEALNNNEKKEFLNTSVFARVTPEQKINIVSFLQKNNNIVAMLGDGINDIPALRKADIGIAMGIRGTEAARESADIILLDDKFTATELAIEQGRVIFQNIRQFVVYLLSCNFAEILSVGVAAILNLPSPLLPLQILFLNVITDIFPALALGLGKGEKDIMQLPPKNPKEPIITRRLWQTTIIYGLTISMAVLGITAYSHFVLELSSIQINNMAFYTLIASQLLNVFNMPARHLSFFNNEVITNPWVWGALGLCIGLTFLAYLSPLVSKVLKLMTFLPINLY
jgi:Ca2+-transporting ATPase